MSKEIEVGFNIPRLRVLAMEGTYWSDGWMTRDLKLSCETLGDISGLEISVWNPDSSVRYAGNVVSVICNQKQWKTSELVMGERADLYIPINLGEGESLDIGIISSSFMDADVMDSRQRGVVVISIAAISGVPGENQVVNSL